MSDTVLLLDTIAFRDFEVASGVSFGGVQRIVQHELPGGVRIIDAMGDRPSQITISGTLSGSEATERARALTVLRSQGAVLPLTWDVFFYSVVVQSFQADFKSSFWIPFRLTCAVLRDEATALVAGVLSLAGSVLSDVGAAIAAAPSGVDLSGPAAAVAAPGATTLGAAAYGTAQGVLGTSEMSLDAGLTAAESGLDPGAVFSGGSAAEGIAAITAASSDAQQLAGFSAARAYLGRAAANLAAAST
jgi:hypothetical protein